MNAAKPVPGVSPRKSSSEGTGILGDRVWVYGVNGSMGSLITASSVDSIIAGFREDSFFSSPRKSSSVGMGIGNRVWVYGVNSG